MITLPPFFSLILFFIIDTLALVCYLTILLSPLGAVINFLGNGLYFTISLVKYGPAKMKDRYLNFKKGSKFKKVVKIFGGSLIPYIHLWSIYDDYKTDLKEAKEKKQEIKLKQEGEIKAQVEARNKTVEVQNKQRIQKQDGGSTQLSDENQTIDNQENIETAGIETINTQAGENPWMMRDKRKPNIQDKKTIAEEVGGIKTGLNREDYDEYVTNYSKQGTYAEDIKEKEEKAKKEREARIKENQQKRIQGLKGKESLRKEMLTRSEKRFGKTTNEAKSLKNKYRESLTEAE